MSLRNFVRDRLGRPSAVWWMLGLAMLLASPGLVAGFLLDDHLHRFFVAAHVQGQRPTVWWDLYHAANGDPVDAHAKMALGVTPWWALPELRIRFFRPLTAATHYLDYWLMPDADVAMHVENFAWYGALVAGVGMLYRRLITTGWVAGLGTLLFAIDDAHGIPLSWIAQRNALMATAIGVATLLAHHRWRQGWRLGALVAPALLGLALLAGELAVGILGYLLAYAFTVDPGRGARRFWTLAPYGAVVLAWRAVYQAVGCGAYGSGSYVDPGREPIAFLTTIGPRYGALWLGQFGFPTSDQWFAYPPFRAFLIPAAIGLAALVAVAAWPALRKRPAARFFAIGAALCLVPLCTVTPSDRVLLPVGVGAAGLIAMAIEPPQPGPEESRLWRWARRIAVAALVVIHGPVAAAALPIQSSGLRSEVQTNQGSAAGSVPRDAALADQDLVIVNAPPTFIPAYVWLADPDQGQALPRKLRILGSSYGTVIVSRPDRRTLVLQPVGGYFHDMFSQVVRGPRHPLPRDYKLDLDGMRLRVTGVAEGKVTEVVFRFAVDLDDDSLRFIAWRGDRFVPFPVPAVGQRVAWASR